MVGRAQSARGRAVGDVAATIVRWRVRCDGRRHDRRRLCRRHRLTRGENDECSANQMQTPCGLQVWLFWQSVFCKHCTQKSSVVRCTSGASRWCSPCSANTRRSDRSSCRRPCPSRCSCSPSMRDTARSNRLACRISVWGSDNSDRSCTTLRSDSRSSRRMFGCSGSSFS